MGVDANALAGFVEAFVGIDALVVIVDLETFGAKAFEGTDSVAANAVTGARGGALVDIYTNVSNQLISRVTIADVRSWDIGTQLIADSIRTFVDVCACSVDVFKTIVAIASVRSL